jgi:hypothetical protein
MRKTLLWLTLVAIVALPRTADASFLDFIWEMSGTQLVGLGPQCEVDGDGKLRCTFLNKAVGRVQELTFKCAKKQPLWLILEPKIYFSTWKNNEKDGLEYDFRFWRTGMLGLDPMFALSLLPDRDSDRLYAAVGVSLNRFFGADVDDAWNGAVKARLGYDRDFGSLAVGLEYNLRFYANGFDARNRVSDDGAIMFKTDNSERVHGFGVSFYF